MRVLNMGIGRVSWGACMKVHLQKPLSSKFEVQMCDSNDEDMCLGGGGCVYN